MVALRPGSSVLKPGVRERQRELETVITKYEVCCVMLWGFDTLITKNVHCTVQFVPQLLLAIARTQNADFDFLDCPQLVYRLAGKDDVIREDGLMVEHDILKECRLCLVRLLRTAWQIDQSGQQPAQTPVNCEEKDVIAADESETMLTTLEDMLEKTRKLYQLPEVANNTLAVQGEVQVLIEKGELFTFCRDHANVMAAYAEAIRLCYNIEDEVTEAILTSKLRKLQRQTDAMTQAKSLMLERESDNNTNEESERNRLKTAFAKVATDGLLGKTQLQSLAQELNLTDALNSEEVDEIWRQVLSSNKKDSDIADPSTRAISFEMFWSWWISDVVCDFMKSNVG